MPVLKWVLEQYKDKSIIFDEAASTIPCASFVESSNLSFEVLNVGGWSNEYCGYY